MRAAPQPCAHLSQMSTRKRDADFRLMPGERTSNATSFGTALSSLTTSGQEVHLTETRSIFKVQKGAMLRPDQSSLQCHGQDR